MSKPMITEEDKIILMNSIPNKDLEKTKPNDVVCKFVMKGKASKLLTSLQAVMNTFIQKDGYGNEKKDYVLTFMLEEIAPK